MNQNIAAYTATEYTNYPAYISINERDEMVEITVRSAESEGQGMIRLSVEHLTEISEAIQAYLKERK